MRIDFMRFLASIVLTGVTAIAAYLYGRDTATAELTREFQAWRAKQACLSLPELPPHIKKGKIRK